MQRSFVGANDAKFISTTSTNKMFSTLIFGRLEKKQLNLPPGEEAVINFDILDELSH